MHYPQENKVIREVMADYRTVGARAEIWGIGPPSSAVRWDHPGASEAFLWCWPSLSRVR